MLNTLKPVTLILGLVFFNGCWKEAPKSALSPKVILVTKAKANLNPLKNSTVDGYVEFERKVDKSILLKGHISGLQKNKKFAMHIHAKGDCSSLEGKSAGGHFNPTGSSHGNPQKENHHVGDLGNISSNSQGEAKIEKVFRDFALNGYFQPIVGRSVIIHEDPDDFKTQPSGGAGKRIACGIIGVIEDIIK